MVFSKRELQEDSSQEEFAFVNKVRVKDGTKAFP